MVDVGHLNPKETKRPIAFSVQDQKLLNEVAVEIGKYQRKYLYKVLTPQVMDEIVHDTTHTARGIIRLHVFKDINSDDFYEFAYMKIHATLGEVELEPVFNKIGGIIIGADIKQE